MSEGNDHYASHEIFSKAVRAGKRTYFFDVKATRGNDLYLTITESKRKYDDAGNFHYEKHKLFLYKEDFEKFEDGLAEAVAKIKSLQENGSYAANESSDAEQASDESFSDVSFEDLDKE